MEDFVKEAQKTFNTHALSYDCRTKEFVTKIKKEIDLFLSLLSGKKIVDLGAGPGRDAGYMKSKGFDVLCVDIAEKMLELCRKKGLKTKMIDINKIEELKTKFDGVWSYTTLHLMPKSEFRKLLPKIKTILKPNGKFFLGMIEGEYDGWKENENKFPGCKRWYSAYAKEELENILKEHFKIIFFSKTETIKLDETKEKKVSCYLNFICELPPT